MSSPNTVQNKHSERGSSLLADTGRCVACGLCLPHCPTYRLMRNEADSPRGRIALARGLASGNLPPSKKLRQHLDRCLGCLACEQVCPSKVAYGQILDQAKQSFSAGNDPAAANWLYSNLTRGRLRRWRLPILFYRYSGVQGLLRKTGLLAAWNLAPMDRLLLRAPTPWRHPAPTRQGSEKVQLFTGCSASLFDHETLDAAHQLLGALHFDVRVPEHQVCCGALSAHRGDTARARSLAHDNALAFESSPIVSTVSGCSAYLSIQAGTDNRPAWQARVMDIIAFLAQVDWPTTVQFAPLPQTIIVHEPCSLRYPLGLQKELHALLSRIPEANCIPLTDASCCGGAGSYPITEPVLANALAQEKVKEIKTLDATLMVTTNLGCALHLEAALREAGISIKVMHPVTLLARQLLR